MSNNKIIKSPLIIIVIIVSLLVVGTSLAYYTSEFSIIGSGNSNITTSEIVQVTLDLEENSDASNIYPGYASVKSFSLKGSGSSKALPATASIIISPDLNEFSDYVYWRLYRSQERIVCTNKFDASDGAAYISECDIPESASLVLSGNSSLERLKVTVNYNTNDKYYLVTNYINKGDQSDLMDKFFDISISLGEKEDDLTDKIIANLDSKGNCPKINDDATVKIGAAETEKSLVCSAPDEYGKSYYFRGNVSNNYVKFANLYWRIVRINGDNSIRLIYDGSVAHENGESSEDRTAFKSAYNTGTFKNNTGSVSLAEIRLDNAAVGYMYGNRNKIVESNVKLYTSSLEDFPIIYIAKSYNYDIKTDLFSLVDPFPVSIENFSSDYVGFYTFFSDSTSSSKAQLNKIVDVHETNSGYDLDVNSFIYGSGSKEIAQENINDSTIKEALDTWYEENLQDYSEFIMDSYYCNNRTFSDSTQGYGNVITKYHYSALDSNHTSLKCFKNDSFTVYNKVIGNGALKHPIGLLSLDEAMLAGGLLNNNSYYLYTGSNWWLMTPLDYYGLNGHIASVNDLGRAYGWTTLTSEAGVKPVINLKPGSLKRGNGTITEPYEVSNN